MSGLADLDLLLPFESRGAELAVAQSDLCPAIVIRARSRRLRLFADMPAWGLGGPTFAAIPTEDGIEILSSANCNSIFACPDILRQSEPWLLCWFEGAEGWDRLVYGQPCHWRGHHPERPFPHIDVPWLIVLQRRPERIEFGSNGLDLVFKGEAGAIVAMPLYGADLLAVEKTRLWREGLPADVTDRCRTWSRRLRRIPIGCRETFSMDEKDDTVVVRQDFDYLAIEDDWATEGEYISPYPPFAALAERWGFPIVFEQPPTVGEVSTLYGPYSFARDAQSATYRIRGMLRYVREDETYPDAPRTAAAGRAVARLRLALADDARLAIKTSGGYTRGLALALTSYARALRYLADEQKPSILEVMSELLGRLLDPTNYMPFIRYSTAEGNPVGEAICQRSRDAYKVVQANLFGLWAATATLGQWEQIVQAWPLIRRWFHLPFQTQWLTALPARWEGLDIARALFDGTAGYARLAAAVGATDDYRFACYLFAKVCAGWFATEMMPRYHREHQPWLFNTDADYLIWHPCRLNGYVLIANDHLLRDEEPEVDGRGWASAFGRISPTCARFWRDHLRDRADEVLNQTLRRCRPDWAQSGAPAVVRSCVLGESPEQMEHHRAADEAAEQAAASHPLRLRTYHLFQSTPIVKEIAMAEAGATPERAAVLAETSPMEKPSEGASQTADRVEQAAMPVRTASLVPLPLAGGELSTGEPPALRPLPPTLGEGKGERNDLSAHLQSAVLLYWPGVRTPKKPFAVLDERLDLFPFGSIQLPDDAISAETSHAGMSHEERHPNWCLTISTFHGPAIEPIHIERQDENALVISWQTPTPCNSVVQYWRHDLGQPRPEIETIADQELTCDHRITLHFPAICFESKVQSPKSIVQSPKSDSYYYRCMSFDTSGRVFRSQPAILPTGRVNWALSCAAFVSKRFPFKEFKYARDRGRWLEEFRAQQAGWNALKPPHELTDGQGLRPGVEPWIRHAESDPSYVHWIAIDLGQPRDVDEVVIAHDPEWVSAGFRIEAGPGDKPWSAALAGPQSKAWGDLLAEESENRSPVSRCSFACRTTRWVRVLYTHPAPVGMTANRLALWEIEVRGPDRVSLPLSGRKYT